ncbi:hypothetical protein L249_2031 [Ophiocordyceps polyrhachis-furcata BCC 54312]|uniref:Uncharacterized protein n=1 Tax=Ophiocordyceps polyrhachis-furcata BCC 54312 TaxID=1330021 RepID=A0A367LNB0_9HYPO|nr:hypothetical protein L249_2031 [Ophiocordyceps polyrhachis-furcata BCC 54312]
MSWEEEETWVSVFLGREQTDCLPTSGKQAERMGVLAVTVVSYSPSCFITEQKVPAYPILSCHQVVSYQGYY